MLVPHAQDVAEELLPGGRRQGREWHCRASQSPTGYAIGVVISGPKAGTVGFFGGERAGGDLLNLYDAVAGGGMGRAAEWAKARLGLTDDAAPPCSASADAARQRQAEALRAKRAHEEALTQAETLDYAHDLWRAAGPIEGTLSERYLLGRGAPRPKRWPRSLRHHDGLRHPTGGTYAALVAGRQNAVGAFAGVYRIFLAPDGGKAPVSPAKAALGTRPGGAVRLGPATRTLAVCEGIETGFGVLGVLAGAPISVWATLGTSQMAALDLPSEVERVLIYADGDRRRYRGDVVVQPGRDAAEKLAARLIESGRTVEILEPQEADWLDVWNRQKTRLGHASRTC